MKELNNFRKFLNEDLDEGVMDKIKKFGKTVKDVSDKMTSGKEEDKGVFAAIDKQLFKKKTQEGEIHEGTWSLGSAQNMEAAITQLQGMMREDNPAAWMQAFEDLDSILYRVFGDDGFHDALGASKAAVEDGDIDRAKNALGDALGIAQKLLAYQVKRNAENLEENDAVLDEIINDGVVDSVKKFFKKKADPVEEPQSNEPYNPKDAFLEDWEKKLKKDPELKKAVDAEVAKDAKVKSLEAKLKNIESMKDRAMTGSPGDEDAGKFYNASRQMKKNIERELYYRKQRVAKETVAKMTKEGLEKNDAVLDEVLNEDVAKKILKKYPKKYKDEKAVMGAAAKLMKNPKFKGKGIGPVLQVLLKGKE